MFQPGRNQGTVLALDGEYALVLHERFDPCILCPGEDDCTEKERLDCSLEVRALNEIRAKVGDTVTLRLEDEGQILRAVLHVYGVPMLFLVLGLFGGAGLAQGLGAHPTVQGGVAVLGMVLALAASLPVSRRLDRWAFERGGFTPVIGEVTTERLEV